MATASAPDGTAIHYEVTGAGEPVRLIHGLTEAGRSGVAPAYGVFDPDRFLHRLEAFWATSPGAD